MMPVIGVTGSFGTGKTTVANLFTRFGAKVIDADALVHHELKQNKKIIKKITSAFGRDILDKKNQIDRNKLGEKVFRDKKKLDRLTRIVHPKIISLIKSEIKNNKKEVLVIDAPLLIEAGLQGLVDYLIVVKLSKGKQILRLKKKYNLSEDELLRRIKAQLPLSRKVRLARFVIDNKGSLGQTESEVKKIWQQIIIK